MYVLMLTTSQEMSSDEFLKVFDLLDQYFEIEGVTSFVANGEEIETVANLKETPEGFLYEFDCLNKVHIDEGDEVVEKLTELLPYDFELNAPIEEN